MPPNAARIPDSQIAMLKRWIDEGHREKSDSKVSVPAKPKLDLAMKVVRGKPEGPPPMPKPGVLPLDPVARGRRANAITALAASPWAPLVAVAGAKQILLYHTDSGDLLGVIPFEHGQINVLKFSRNAKLLLAAGGRGGQSGKAVLYDVETGKKVTEVGIETDAILAADLSPDQSQIAVGSPSKLVRCYATADGSVLREIKKHTDWVTAVEFSPDGVLLASGDRNGGVFVWEANTGREFHTIRGHTAMIADLSWRADANLLATGSEDGTIRMWEMENGRQIKSWGAHGGGVQAVKFANDGTIASTGRDRVTKHWDGNGNLKKQFEPFADTGLRVAVSHDSAKVIAGDWAGQVKEWAVADGKLFASLDANPPPVAQQVEELTKRIAEADANIAKQTEAKTATQAALTKANESLAVVTKAVATLREQTTADAKSVTAAKAAFDQATVALGTTQRTQAARQLWANQMAGAAKAMQDAAAKDAKNAELAAVVAEANALTKKATDDLATATKASADATANHAKAKQAFDAVRSTTAGKQAAIVEAEKKVAEAKNLVTKATAEAQAAGGKLAALAADRKAMAEKLDRMPKPAAKK
jgi:hypothetical protein